MRTIRRRHEYAQRSAVDAARELRLRPGATLTSGYGDTTVVLAPEPSHRAAHDTTKEAGTGYIPPRLTAHEIVVLRAWLRCDSKAAVAQQLHIALGTVNTYLTRIRQKYSSVGRPAPTKAALVVRALQDGIVALDDL